MENANDKTGIIIGKAVYNPRTDDSLWENNPSLKAIQELTSFLFLRFENRLIKNAFLHDEHENPIELDNDDVICMLDDIHFTSRKGINGHYVDFNQSFPVLATTESDFPNLLKRHFDESTYSNISLFVDVLFKPKALKLFDTAKSYLAETHGKDIELLNELIDWLNSSGYVPDENMVTGGFEEFLAYFRDKITSIPLTSRMKDLFRRLEKQRDKLRTANIASEIHEVLEFAEGGVKHFKQRIISYYHKNTHNLNSQEGRAIFLDPERCPACEDMRMYYEWLNLFNEAKIKSVPKPVLITNYPSIERTNLDYLAEECQQYLFFYIGVKHSDKGVPTPSQNNAYMAKEFILHPSGALQTIIHEFNLNRDNLPEELFVRYCKSTLAGLQKIKGDLTDIKEKYAEAYYSKVIDSEHWHAINSPVLAYLYCIWHLEEKILFYYPSLDTYGITKVEHHGEEVFAPKATAKQIAIFHKIKQQNNKEPEFDTIDGNFNKKKLKREAVNKYGEAAGKDGEAFYVQYKDLPHKLERIPEPDRNLAVLMYLAKDDDDLQQAIIRLNGAEK